MSSEKRQYLSTKVSSELYAVFGEQAAMRAWLLAEAAEGHLADTPAGVAFMLKHGGGQ